MGPEENAQERVPWRQLAASGLRPVQETSIPLYERTSRFRIYESDIIPGLFQTPAYARAVMRRVAAFHEIPDDIDEAADVRIARQRVIHESGHQISVVLEQGALHARTPTPGLMLEQLHHLAHQADLPSVSLGIIPTGIAGRWPAEGFWIFDDAQVSVELTATSLTITDSTEITQYVKAFGELANLAAYGTKARSLITAAINALA